MNGYKNSASQYIRNHNNFNDPWTAKRDFLRRRIIRLIPFIALYNTILVNCDYDILQLKVKMSWIKNAVLVLERIRYAVVYRLSMQGRQIVVYPLL